MKFQELYPNEKKRISQKILRLPYTFYAHPEEPLDVHLDFTVEQFLYFIREMDLEGILDSFIEKLFPENQDSFKREILRIIYLHDWGKINPLFQKEKMNNPLPIEKTFSSIGTKHSKLGYFLHVNDIVNGLSNGLINDKYAIFSLLFATIILRHHSPLEDIEFSSIFSEEELKDMIDLSIFFGYSVSKFEVYNKIFTNIDISKDKILSEEIFYFYKILYSLLVTSDFYASGWQNSRVSLGTINKDLIRKIRYNFYEREVTESGFFNFNTLIEKNRDHIREINISSENLKKKSKENLNKLRNFLNLYIEERIEKEVDKGNRLYYLSLPTGAGKTNISLRATLKIIEKVPIKKVYYVLPFINIIDQVYFYVKDVLDLTLDEIVRLDTGAIYENVEVDEEEKFYTDILFTNYPFIFTSHVGFFDVILRKKKSKNFNFFKLSNSVIIFDEIQAYDDKLWTVLMFTLSQIATLLNSYIIVMSATLPPIEKGLKDKYKEKYKFVELIESEVKDIIYHNPNFLERVEVRPIDNLFPKAIHKVEDKDIFLFVKERLKNENIKKYLIVVNSIKKSYELYHFFISLLHGEADIFLLNSTILPVRRKQIIDIFKSKTEKRLILISTQVVEAGVDLDADEGLREFAILDSIEQVAGRVNRNASKDKAYLFVFASKSFPLVYRNSYRAKAIKNYTIKELKDMIIYRKFDEFYRDVIAEIYNKAGKMLVQTSQDHIEDFAKLRFSTIDQEIKIIDSYDISIFIPIDFSEEFLSPALREVFIKHELLEDGKVKGKKVWERYIKMIENKEDYSTGNIKLFSHFLRQFTISLSIFYFKDINFSVRLEHGFLYLKNWESCYSLEHGLDIEEFNQYLEEKDLEERII